MKILQDFVDSSTLHWSTHHTPGTRHYTSTTQYVDTSMCTVRVMAGDDTDSILGGETLHVSILRENLQDQCQLQEAHENSHWKLDSSEPDR